MIPKYRGRSISEENKGQWVYGNLIVDGDCAYIINGVIECNDQYITIAEWCPVEPKTVGASTDLFESKGAEIFEGDVVVFEDCDDVDTDFVYANRGVIEYTAPTFHITNRDSTEMEDLLDGNILEVEVLGNIHEHPHLLEVG